MRNKSSSKQKDHFDTLFEFIIEKGPSMNFWFYVFIISTTIWLVWTMLKLAGVINTPLWQKMIYLIAGIASISSLIIHVVSKAMNFGREHGTIMTRLDYIEKTLEKHLIWHEENK